METIEHVTQILNQIPGAVLEKSRFGRSGYALFWLDAARLADCARALRDRAGFDFLENLSSMQIDENLIFTYFAGRSETGELMVFRVSVPLKSPKDWIELDSVAAVWPMAAAQEEEIARLFGVKIAGCSPKKTWDGFPLRKSFKMAGGGHP